MRSVDTTTQSLRGKSPFRSEEFQWCTSTAPNWGVHAVGW